jgi:hypothetical protein
VGIIVLVLFDSICVASELILIIENSKENNICHTINNTIRNNRTKNDENIGHTHHPIEIILLILKYIGITILGIFIIEILIKIIFNTRAFFKTKMEIFDALVVAISFVLDILFFEHQNVAIQLLTLLRLW